MCLYLCIYLCLHLHVYLCLLNCIFMCNHRNLYAGCLYQLLCSSWSFTVLPRSFVRSSFCYEVHSGTWSSSQATFSIFTQPNSPQRHCSALALNQSNMIPTSLDVLVSSAKSSSCNDAAEQQVRRASLSIFTQLTPQQSLRIATTMPMELKAVDATNNHMQQLSIFIQVPVLSLDQCTCACV